MFFKTLKRNLMKKILLLGSGELGKELTISLKRMGCYVITCDAYENAPAMQVSDQSEVFNMLDKNKLKKIIENHKPDFIVPEVESIRTERLYEYEKQGYTVIPSAKAANFTMNRKAIRDLASKELGLKTANYRYATSAEELKKGVSEVGIPCVVKPLMSSSGKGQSTIKTEEDIEKAKAVILEAIKNVPKVLEHPVPFVGVIGFGDSSVDLTIRPFARSVDYWEVYFASNEAIKKALDDNNIEIPYPHQVEISKKI